MYAKNQMTLNVVIQFHFMSENQVSSSINWPSVYILTTSKLQNATVNFLIGIAKNYYIIFIWNHPNVITVQSPEISAVFAICVSAD